MWIAHQGYRASSESDSGRPSRPMKSHVISIGVGEPHARDTRLDHGETPIGRRRAELAAARLGEQLIAPHPRRRRCGGEGWRRGAHLEKYRPTGCGDTSCRMSARPDVDRVRPSRAATSCTDASDTQPRSSCTIHSAARRSAMRVVVLLLQRLDPVTHGSRDTALCFRGWCAQRSILPSMSTLA